MSGHASCLTAHMEQYSHNAIAVQWEFRCHGNDMPAHAWEWKCRSREGTIVAKSKASFKSLRDAIRDAEQNGFQYRLQAG